MGLSSPAGGVASGLLRTPSPSATPPLQQRLGPAGVRAPGSVMQGAPGEMGPGIISNVPQQVHTVRTEDGSNYNL